MVRTVRAGLFFFLCELRGACSGGPSPAAVRAIVNEALEVLSVEFEWLNLKMGRPSIPPEKLVRALLLQAFYTIRSDR